MTPMKSEIAALGPAGTALYGSVSELHDLSPAEQVLLVEACRAKDRADKLHALLVGDAQVWARLAGATAADGPAQVRLDGVLREANRTGLLVAQLIGALRLPDPRTGRRPSRRPPRGVYRPRLV